MAGTSSAPLTQAEARALHGRLLGGDPTASSDLAFACLDWLAARLIAENPQVDEHLCSQAAEEALLGLIRRPGSYDPERAPLETYLRISARGDLRNLLQREQRHRSRQASLEAVEVSPEWRNRVQDADADPARIAEMHEMVIERAQMDAPRLEKVRDGLDAREQHVLALMHGGERKTAVYAAALGIDHLTPLEQRREVKRVKDRLTKRLERVQP